MNIKPLDILHKYYGYTSFRKGQENIITSIINKEDVLAIMPTGGGKSICYQVPALCLDGITIVISPLISLMKDQVDALKTMGVKARLINSSLSNSEYNEALEEIENDECKIIYIAPERLDSMEFVNIIRGKNISQVAIDEAHCVSQWGHDFRVSYKKIPYFINRLDKRPIVTAFTATASNEVREDIINILNLHNPAVYITGFDRENLSINIVKSCRHRLDKDDEAGACGGVLPLSPASGQRPLPPAHAGHRVCHLDGLDPARGLPFSPQHRLLRHVAAAVYGG